MAQKPKRVALKTVRRGPIRHKSMPPKLLEQIKSIYDTIGRYVGCNTLEQFEIDFMRDAHPEREVAIWTRIKKAWVAYHEGFLNGKVLSDKEELALIGALLLISMGVRDVKELRVPVGAGRRLLECYDNLANE